MPNQSKIYSKLNPYYIVKDKEDHTLVFESRFESGNLKKVKQIDPYEYELYLKNDHGSATNVTQWFYFRVSNT